MKISAQTLYLALSRLLRVQWFIFFLIFLFQLLVAAFSTFGILGGLAIALWLFIFLSIPTITIWAVLEMLMPRLPVAAFHLCAALLGAMLMLAYWLLRVGKAADLLFLPVLMIVSAALGALFSVYLLVHQRKYAPLPVEAPQTKRKKAFAVATLFVVLVSISGYLVSDYSNTATMRVQKGETARLRYFRPTSHDLPGMEIDLTDDFAENSDWDFFEKNSVTLHLRSDNGCEQILRSEWRNFAEIAPSAICQSDGGFHHLDVEIIDVAPAAMDKALHTRLEAGIHLKSLSYHPYYLFAQLYFGVAGLWIWLALWGAQLVAQKRAARASKTPSATV